MNIQCEGSEGRYLALLFHRKVELQRETLLITDVSPKVECLHQILNFSLYNLQEKFISRAQAFSPCVELVSAGSAENPL